MKIIKLQQGTAQWITWRRRGIGASDISVIIGSNPYKTKLQLFNEKCGYDNSSKLNEAMKHGIRNEEEARKAVNKALSLNLEDICVEDDEKPFIRASLDGWDKNKKILVELKCPVADETIAKAAIEEEIHQYWYDQVLWQASITNPVRAYCAVWNWREKNTYLIEIKRDKERELFMREEGEKFWNDHIIKGIAPEPSDKDYIEVEDPELEKLVKEYISVTREDKIIGERKKELKKKIEDFGDDGNFMAYGIKVKRCPPHISYDIKAMKEDGIEVECYRKEPKSIGYYRIIVPKCLLS